MSVHEDAHEAALTGTAAGAALAGGATDTEAPPRHPIEATPNQPGQVAQVQSVRPTPGAPFSTDPSTGPPIELMVPEPDPLHDHQYWFSLIDEREAGKFVGVGARAMQAWRQRGGGPRFIRISARCIRYRRADLRDWAYARMRASTSDPGSGSPGAKAA